MNNYRPSSELQRDTEQLINNHNRHASWLKKSAIYRYHEKAFKPEHKKEAKLDIRNLI